MNLYKEVIDILLRAKVSNEYFNPRFINTLLQAYEDADKFDEVPYELLDRSYDMWSR